MEMECSSYKSLAMSDILQHNLIRSQPQNDFRSKSLQSQLLKGPLDEKVYLKEQHFLQYSLPLNGLVLKGKITFSLNPKYHPQQERSYFLSPFHLNHLF